jgi:diguanylate cyclase (GGDEF)-like protein
LGNSASLPPSAAPGASAARAICALRGILARAMALLDPRLIEIEILSEVDRKTFAGGRPYEHRRSGTLTQDDQLREEALLELVDARAIVFADSYRRASSADQPLIELANQAAYRLLDAGEMIIPLKITQRGRLRLFRLRDEILSRDRIRDDFGVLWSGRHFEPDLTVHLRSRDPGSPISLLAVDVDKLKDLNSDIGHPDATKVLMGIFEELRDIIRPHQGYRTGHGDEATAILVDVPLEEAEKLAEQVRARVEARDWPGLKFERHPTVSVGVATLTDEMTADAFYKAVDRLIYRAKQTRNTVAAAVVPEPK